MATPKTLYTATRADGSTVTRTSPRGYSHYWEVVDADGAHHNGGFSATEALARSAANSALNAWTGRMDYEQLAVRRKPAGKYARFATPAWFKWAADAVRAHGGKEAWEREVLANEATRRVNLIPVA